MSDTTTTIQVSKQVRDELAKRGSKGDTFDTILQRLLAKAEASK